MMLIIDILREACMDKQEKELLEGFRRLPPESKNLVISTVITATTAYEAALRELAQRGIGGPSYTLPDARPAMEAQA
jgi:hypothetical protein